MEKLIHFTDHAMNKFDDLKAVGFEVTPEQVVDTIRRPDYVDREADPPIAQKRIDERHLLRVVFVEEVDVIRVVTFYPSRRVRYEP